MFALLSKALFSPGDTTSSEPAEEPQPRFKKTSISGRNRASQIDELVAQLERTLADFEVARAMVLSGESPDKRQERLQRYYNTLDRRVKHVLNELEVQEMALSFSRKEFDEVEFDRLYKEIQVALKRRAREWANDSTKIYF